MPLLQIPANNSEFKELAGDGGLDTDYSWEQLARRQIEQVHAYGQIIPSNMSSGDCIAMEDRQNFADDFNRHVFVLIGDDTAMIFDENGDRIDDDGVSDGLQPLRGDNGFLSEWSEGYYRAGVVDAVDPGRSGSSATQAEAQAALDAVDPGRSGSSATQAEAQAALDAVDPGRSGSSAMQAEAQAAQASRLKLLTTAGQRIQEEFKEGDDDVSTKSWYGGIVGDAHAYAGEKIPYGFDDGDLCIQSISDIAKLADLGALMTNTRECGLVSGEEIQLKAVALSYMKCGSTFAPVGVLLNDDDVVPLCYPVYSSHVVSIKGIEAALELQSATSPTRATAKEVKEGGKFKDRLGFHTFKRCDAVNYEGDAGGLAMQETVFGVQLYSFRGQQHRNLITFDPQLKEFSVQHWTAWSCTPVEPGKDLDTTDHKSCSVEDLSEMLTLWPKSELVKEGTTHDKIKKLIALGPSKVREENRQKRMEAERLRKERAKRAREETKKSKEAAEQARKEAKREQERLEQERLDREQRERLDREERERSDREQQERSDREQQERSDREQQERSDREQRERLAREQRERSAREQWKRLDREQREHSQREKQERSEREQSERSDASLRIDVDELGSLLEGREHTRRGTQLPPPPLPTRRRQRRHRSTCGVRLPLRTGDSTFGTRQLER